MTQTFCQLTLQRYNAKILPIAQCKNHRIIIACVNNSVRNGGVGLNDDIIANDDIMALSLENIRYLYLCVLLKLKCYDYNYNYPIYNTACIIHHTFAKNCRLSLLKGRFCSTVMLWLLVSPIGYSN
jgi:hypothetical protein